MVKKIFMLILIFGCSGPVLERGGRHPTLQQPAPANRMAKNLFDGMKKKLVLLSFLNESPYGGDDLGIVAAEELRRELAGSGQFIVDSTSEKIFGNSKKIYAGGGGHLTQLSRQAKTAGINFIVFGRVLEARIRERTDEIGLIRKTKSYSESKVEIRVFDVNSNKEIYNQTIHSHANDSALRLFTQNRENHLTYRRELLRYTVKVAVRKSIPEILDASSKLNWTGRVAKIIGNKVYINAGRNSGLQISDILKVITEGQEIYDPETGAMIGVSKGEVKGTIEVIDYFGPDGAIAILHSGGAILEGDFVQLY